MTAQIDRRAITLDVTDGVAELTVGTGLKRNALGDADWVALADAVSTVADDSTVVALVLRGAAETFCAGSDLTQWIDASEEVVARSFALIESALMALEDLAIPTIAAVEGFATGAGCELALACDVVIVAPSAKLGIPVVQLGIRVPPGFMRRLIAAVGQSKALAIMYSGRLIGAAEAVELGIAAESVAELQLDAAIALWTTRIADQPRDSLAGAKLATRIVTGAAIEPQQWRYRDPSRFSAAVNAFMSRRTP